MNDHKAIRDHIYKRLGLNFKKAPSLPELKKTEWNSDFEKKMRDRLIMGALRYAPMKSKKQVGGRAYDRIEFMLKKLQLYCETGNLEYLVDLANGALLEYTLSIHPKKHFKAMDRR